MPVLPVFINENLNDEGMWPYRLPAPSISYHAKDANSAKL
jgi:hypothetical protein